MIRQAAALRLLFTLAVSLPTAAHSVRIPISVSPGDQQLGRASQSGKLSCVAITRFATPAEIKTLHWPAITDLGQAINKLVCDASGNVKPDDVVTWPMKHLVDAAHGNGTRIYTALSFDSKHSAASFFLLHGCRTGAYVGPGLRGHRRAAMSACTSSLPFAATTGAKSRFYKGALPRHLTLEKPETRVQLARELIHQLR
jgi:hypothetical protein